MVNSRALLATLALATVAPAISPAAPPDGRPSDIARPRVAPAASVATESSSPPAGSPSHEVPLVVRFNPKGPDEAEVSLRAAVTMARYHFLRVFQEQLLGRRPTEADIGSPAYLRTLAEVRPNAPAGFPFDHLSTRWVSDESDEIFILTLARPIRQAMAEIIAEDSAIQTVSAHRSLRLVIAKNLLMPVGVGDLEGPGLIVSGSKIVTLSHARQLVKNHFPASQDDLARFAALFVRPNIRPDPAATRQLLLQTTSPAKETSSASKNPASPVPAGAGTRPATVPPAVGKTQTVSTETILLSPAQNALRAPAPSPASWAPKTRRLPRVIAASLASLALIAGACWFFARRRRSPIFPRPAKPASRPEKTRLIILDTPEDSRGSGQDRPRRNPLRPPVVRNPSTGPLSSIARAIVHALFRHRSELLAAQQQARAEIEHLERRLEELHAPLQARIQSYEKRIAELEEKLAAKGEETRHLLDARLTLARQQLERTRYQAN